MEQALKLVQLTSGQEVFREGTLGKSFFIVKDGEIEVYKNKEEGEVVLGKVTAGQTLGEFSLITGERRSASARAKGDAVVAELSEGAYRAMLSELPTWAQSILETTIHRLTVANEMMVKFGKVEKEEIAAHCEQACFAERESAVKVELEEDFPSLPTEIPK